MNNAAVVTAPLAPIFPGSAPARTVHAFRTMECVDGALSGVCTVGDVPAIEDRLAKLVRKATKLGLTPPELTLGAPFLASKWNDEDQVKDYATLVEYRVEYPEVQVAGWSFVAALDLTEAGVVTRALRGGVDLSAYRGVEPSRCDHCKTRRARKGAFVLVEDATGTEMVVGSSCLADFLGRTAATGVSAALFPMRLIAAFEDDFAAGWGGTWAHSPLEFLTVVVAAMRVMGAFVTRRQAEATEGVSTATLAGNYLFAARKAEDFPELHAHLQENGEACQGAALAALEWAQGLEGRSDFEHNMKVVAGTWTLNSKHEGICAYIAECYRRSVAKAAEAKLPKAAKKVSAHVGTVGKREVFEAKVVRIRAFEGQYGLTVIHAFETLAGDRLVWFGSKSLGLDEGTVVTFKATVKRHQTAKTDGAPETVVTRLTLV